MTGKAIGTTEVSEMTEGTEEAERNDGDNLEDMDESPSVEFRVTT